MNTPDTLPTLKCDDYWWDDDEGEYHFCEGGHERLTASLIAENERYREAVGLLKMDAIESMTCRHHTFEEGCDFNGHGIDCALHDCHYMTADEVLSGLSPIQDSPEKS